MKKFWRSGMIDKKVIEKRKQDDYMNKLHRTILELSIKPPEPKPCSCHKDIDINALINDIEWDDWVDEVLEYINKWVNKDKADVEVLDK
ncbi:hypothetical protein PP215_gp26 [Streptococcus phage CHPC919]|uniref:Uncharacterized protein n=1 Tax=Streptococcus phage CHPC919 TaxID=2365046 RepID=A0A3G8F7L8_9CAUD|nr:hypothetical protein PP215_gp26 [Streptococcus phage CHPC919]AZF90781.1 hypothetical protein CHPC919_0026 [Streptococcus phage CHPC919]